MAEKPSITPHEASLPRTQGQAAIAARLTAELDALARIAELEVEPAAGTSSNGAPEIGDSQAAHLWAAGIAFGSASDLARRTPSAAAPGRLAEALHAFVLTECPAELQSRADRFEEDHGGADCPLGARAAEITARIAFLIPDSPAAFLDDMSCAPGA